MSIPLYTFTIEGSSELAKQLTEAIQQRPVIVCEDLEVFKGICEILWRHEFRPFHNGMVRESTGCCFNWECLLKYKTVVDFQIEWKYS